ncbi:hypothetical protein [Actinacidiphila glaucinigra]|uniref:hypothetical protein n=1 Tax=Actinacidiphila glaucinigra TaxID=235986 RepID=UPI0036EEF43F
MHVMSVRATVAGRNLVTGETAWSDPLPDLTGDSVLPLATPDGDTRTKIMLYSGAPLGEPISFGGPFVTNADFHAGKFGEVPRLARLERDR